MKFRDVLTKIMQLSEASRAEAEADEGPLGHDHFQDLHRRYAPHPKQDKLVAAVGSLLFERIRKMFALARTGRESIWLDDCDVLETFGKFDEQFAGWGGLREAAVRWLVKLPLHDYLAMGLQIAEDAGLDIEGDWESERLS